VLPKQAVPGLTVAGLSHVPFCPAAPHLTALYPSQAYFYRKSEIRVRGEAFFFLRNPSWRSGMEREDSIAVFCEKQMLVIGLDQMRDLMVARRSCFPFGHLVTLRSGKE
jgi:hypothetical protein